MGGGGGYISHTTPYERYWGKLTLAEKTSFPLLSDILREMLGGGASSSLQYTSMATFYTLYNNNVINKLNHIGVFVDTYMVGGGGRRALSCHKTLSKSKNYGQIPLIIIWLNEVTPAANI